MVRTYSAREFNRDTAGAKRAAEDGPVYVTDRGRPSHVLLSMAEYERLVAGAAGAAVGRGPVDPLRFLALPEGVADVELPLDEFPDAPPVFDDPGLDA